MKILRSAALIAALSLAFAAPSLALDLPSQSEKDHRVRYVDYDPANVTQMDAVIGVATHILLEKGEEYVYHVFGDSEAYQFTHKLNHLFFKPIADQADTNLTVITDRREYTFRISYHSDRNSKALYKLIMRYPDSEAEKIAQKNEQQIVQHAWEAGKPATFNWQTYTKSGSVDLAPVHAWDDGRHTSMQFAPHAELPAIYYVDAEGQESIANYHMSDSNTIVLHRIAAKWYLRLGGRVTAIHNHGFGKLEKPVDTGTVSADIVRVVEGEAPAKVPAFQTSPMFNVQSFDLNIAPLATLPPIQSTSDSNQMNQAEPVPMNGAPASMPSSKALPVAPPAPVHTSVPTPGTEIEPGEPISAVQNTPATTPAISGNYRVRSGDTALLPTTITVSGGNTTFNFKSSDIPAISPLDEAGQEQIVGMHVEPDNAVVIHAESDSWKLKKGQASLLLDRKE